MKDHVSTRGYERALLEEVTLDHFHYWQHRTSSSTMVAPREPSRRLRATLHDVFPLACTVLVDDCYVQLSGQRVYVGDVVLLPDGGVGKVMLHCSVDGALYSVVEVWAIRYARAGELICFMNGDINLFCSEDIVAPTVYREKSDSGLATVLVPRMA